MRCFLHAKEISFITRDFNVNAFNKNTELQPKLSDFQQIVIVPFWATFMLENHILQNTASM